MADSGTYTPETVARKLAMAQQLLGDRKKPVTHWAEGLDELAKGYFGGKMYADAERSEKEAEAGQMEAIASLLGGGGSFAGGATRGVPNVPSNVSTYSDALRERGVKNLETGTAPIPNNMPIPVADETPSGIAPQARIDQAFQAFDSGSGGKTGAPTSVISDAEPMGALPGMPRGLRNNNPLNIEAGDFTKGQTGYAGSDGRFAKFASLDQGIGAADNLLTVYSKKHGLNTVSGIVNRWAPPSDNNPTSAYAATVAKSLGVSPNQPIDMSDPSVRRRVIDAMAEFENGKRLPQAQPAVLRGPPPLAQPIPNATSGDRPVMPANDIRSRVVEMLNSPNPGVRKIGKSLATNLIQKQMTPADYDIQQRPDGTVIAVNKKNPEDMRVINAPGAGKSAIQFEADKAAAVARAKGEAEKLVGKEDKDKEQKQVANVVIQDIDRAINTIDTSTLPTTGMGGQLLSNVGGTAARDVGALIDTVKANAGFSELQKMRNNSPTGGALGQVSEREIAYLQATIGNLEQSQSADQLKDNLRRVKNAYMDIIHGEGKGPEREKLTFQEKPKVRKFNPATGKIE